MKRPTMNSIVDGLSLVGFTLLAATGFLLRFVLPPGSGRLVGEGNGLMSARKPIALVWGMTGHQWGTIHYWIAVAFMSALAIHLVLHWRAIVCLVKGQPAQESGIRAGMGVVGAVFLLALAAAPFFSPKEIVPRSQLQERMGAASGPSPEAGKDLDAIQGTMTLRDAEKRTGVPVSVLKRKLGLPPDASPDERLGRLRRQYGFEMQDVRRAAEEGEPCTQGGTAPCGK